MTSDPRTTRTLRVENRANVLRHMLRHGESTRAEIATDLALSPTTVTKVVADLFTEGLLEESGSHPSDGGRPITRISVRAEGAYLVGANVGDQSVTAEVFDLRLSPVSVARIPLESRTATPDRLVVALDAAIDAAILDAGSPPVHGIGVALPGIVETAFDPSTPTTPSITLSAQSLGWASFAIDAFHGPDAIPVYADNAAKRLAAVEMWFGAAREAPESVVAIFGRGVGLGIVSGSRIVTGAASSAGEWGHTKVSIGGPRCACGAEGCLEAYVGGLQVARRWREAGGEPSSNEETAFAELLDAVDRGEQIADGILQSTLHIMGIGLANLVNIFNPERVVVGGWLASALRPAEVDVLLAHTRDNSLEHPRSQFDLVQAVRTQDSFALGAALLALEAIIEER